MCVNGAFRKNENKRGRAFSFVPFISGGEICSYFLRVYSNRENYEEVLRRKRRITTTSDTESSKAAGAFSPIRGSSER